LSEKPPEFKMFMVRAEISFPDRPPMKDRVSIREESDERAIDKACEQLKRQHPKARNMTLSTESIQINYKKETKGWVKKRL